MEKQITKEKIEAFLAQKEIAVVGYSRNPGKFGATVSKTLREKGYQVYPVNPNGGESPEGLTIYPDLQSLPDNVNAALIITRPGITEVVLKQALDKGIKNIWVQQMSDNPRVKELLSESSANIIFGKCILMFAEPSGIHKFHAWLMKVFGKMPK